MEIEKEIRYKVTEEQIKNIKKISKQIGGKYEQKDLTLGYDGFESLKKYGYVCRVREKNNRIWMEVKNRKEDGTFYETKIDINSFYEGIEFYKAIGMKPYMYMNRIREILDYKGLKIFIDYIELLGNYVEIEYQEIDNYKDIINEFINNTKIEPIQQPLYGDIYMDLIHKDKEFKEKLDKELSKF